MELKDKELNEQMIAETIADILKKGLRKDVGKMKK